MITVAALRKLVEAGLTAAQILVVAEAMETQAEEPQKARSTAAARQARYRARCVARDAGGDEESSHGDGPRYGRVTPGVTPSPPSLPLPPEKGVSPPAPPLPKKQTPIPDPPPPKGPPALESRFTEFWAEVPKAKRVDPKRARESFDKAVKGGATADEIVAGYRAAKRSSQWVRDDGRFIPHPTTWLNQERWKIEYDEANSAGEELSEAARRRARTMARVADSVRDFLQPGEIRLHIVSDRDDPFERRDGEGGQKLLAVDTGR
jgi:hypothetical protein